MPPKITRIGSDTFRVEGGTVAPSWTPRPGKTPWCEISVRGDFLSSYGGEVWPTAWPDLFAAPTKRTLHNGGHVYLTPAGLLALATASVGV